MGVENSFVMKERMELLTGHDTMFYLRLGRGFVVFPRGVLFWAKCIQILGGFVLDKYDYILELTMPVRIKAEDSFLRIKKKMG